MLLIMHRLNVAISIKLLTSEHQYLDANSVLSTEKLAAYCSLSIEYYLFNNQTPTFGVVV